MGNKYDEYGRMIKPVTVNGSLVPIEITAGGTDVVVTHLTVAATATATLPAVAGKRVYVTGFEVTGSGATTKTMKGAHLDGVNASPLYYYVTVPEGADVAITPLIVQFTRPLPATAINGAVALVVPSFGTGNAAQSAVLHGFYIDEEA